jgi:hypothetical protein
MDTIANRCKIIKKIRNNQIKSDINASMAGEKLLMPKIRNYHPIHD